MPPVVAAVSAVASAFAASAVGSFLTTTVVGRLITGVAISALRRAIAKRKRPAAPEAPRDPGIRTNSTQTGGTTPGSFVLGRYATDGQMVAPIMSHTSPGSSTPNNMLTYVIELGDLPGQQLHQLIIDGEFASIENTQHPDYGAAIGGRFAGGAWVRFYDGSQTAADPMLLQKYGTYPHRPWAADMVGKGICYAIVTFKYNRERYANFPRVRFVMDGIPLYDPRADSSGSGSGDQRWADRSTWVRSSNPMVMIYNILRGIDLGGGKSWGGASLPGDLPLSRWFAAMNACDQAVDLGGGSSEPAYRAGYEVYVDDEPAGVIEELLKACSGELAEMGGRFIPRVGPPGLPVYYFTDQDILISSPREMDAFPEPDETFNTVTATYPDPDTLWEPREAPERVDSDALTEDGGPLIASLQFDAVPYAAQVQRLMKADLADDRRFRRHNISLPSDAIPIEPLDAVAWTSARHGYDLKVFEVTGVVDPVMTSQPRLALRERDQNDYVVLPGDIIATPAPDPAPASETNYVHRPALHELDPSVGYVLAGNLILNSDLTDGAGDWAISGTSPAHDATTGAILTPGQAYSGGDFPTYAIVQTDGADTGETVLAYRPLIARGQQGHGVSVTPGQVMEFQIRASVARCTLRARIRWFDLGGVDLGVSDDLFSVADAPGDPNVALHWPVYWGRETVPAGTAYASPELVKSGTHTGATPADSAVHWHSPQMAATVDDALTIVPYRPGRIGVISANRMQTGTITADSGIIGDAAITTAKIQNLSVETIKIAENAVTVPVALQTRSSHRLDMSYDAGPDGIPVSIFATCPQFADSYTILEVDGARRWRHRVAVGTMLSAIEYVDLSPGIHTITLRSTNPVNNDLNLFVLGVKR